MIVSHKHKFIFIHVPKVAGNSIAHALLPCLGSSDLNTCPIYLASQEYRAKREAVLRRNEALCKKPLKPHMGIQAVCHLMDVKEFEAYWKFGFVRNPWDREVSLYYFYVQKVCMECLDKKEGGSVEGFHEWLLDDSIDLNPELPAIKPTSLYNKRLPQYIHLYSEADELMVDFVGRYESLSRDFDTLTRKLGLGGLQLPRINVSLHRKDYREYYDDETRALVGSWFQRDIDLFNYGFEGAKR